MISKLYQRLPHVSVFRDQCTHSPQWLVDCTIVCMAILAQTKDCMTCPMLHDTKKLWHTPYTKNITHTLSDTLFLSKLTSFFKKPASDSRCFEVLQSAFFFISTHTAPITCMTRSGGLVYTRISEMSDLSRESRAMVASCRAGNTEARSRWACCHNKERGKIKIKIDQHLWELKI